MLRHASAVAAGLVLACLSCPPPAAAVRAALSGNASRSGASAEPALCRPFSRIRVGNEGYRDSNIEEFHVLTDVSLHNGTVQLHLPTTLLDLGRRRLDEEAWPYTLPVEEVSQELHCQCDKVVETPTHLFIVIFFPHYGHTMFDTIVALYSVIKEAEEPLGGTQLYASFYPNNPPAQQMAKDGALALGEPWDTLLGLMSGQPPRGLKHLIDESRTQRICFKKLVVGLSSKLSHYHSGAPFFDPAMGVAFADEMRQLMPMEPFYDPQCTFRITIIDRKGTRSILNVEDLQAGLREELSLHQVPNSCVDRWSFERMHIGQQLHIMAHTQVLLGVDGTGFLNAMFMPPDCSACVLVTPVLQSKLEPGKEMEFRAVCSKVPGLFLMHENNERGSFQYPAGLGPHAGRDTLVNGTDAEVADLHNNCAPTCHHITRTQNLRVNITMMRSLAARAITHLQDKPMCSNQWGPSASPGPAVSLSL